MDFRSFLQQEIVRRCEKNKSYSLRAFSRSIGVDVSTLSKVLSGQRLLGPKALSRWGSSLGLSPAQIRMYVNRDRNSFDEGQTKFNRLQADVFALIADWHHYAILELMGIDSFKPDVKWVARKLEISVAEVRVAVERLERLNMLEIQEAAWVDRTGGKTSNLPNGVVQNTDVAAKKHQRQVLTKALEALDNVPVEARDHTSLTMAIDRNRLPEAREVIRQFRRQMAALLSHNDSRDEVYNLGVALYPITRIENPLKKKVQYASN